MEENGLGEQVSATTNLGYIYADTGLVSTPVGVWLVSVMDLGDRAYVEEVTGARTQWVSAGELDGLISRDQIVCGITLAALAKLRSSSHWYVP